MPWLQAGGSSSKGKGFIKTRATVKGSTRRWIAWRVAYGGHGVFHGRAALHLQHCRLQPQRQRRALSAQLENPD